MKNHHKIRSFPCKCGLKINNLEYIRHFQSCVYIFDYIKDLEREFIDVISKKNKEISSLYIMKYLLYKIDENVNNSIEILESSKVLLSLGRKRMKIKGKSKERSRFKYNDRNTDRINDDTMSVCEDCLMSKKEYVEICEVCQIPQCLNCYFINSNENNSYIKCRICDSLIQNSYSNTVNIKKNNKHISHDDINQKSKFQQIQLKLDQSPESSESKPCPNTNCKAKIYKKSKKNKEKLDFSIKDKSNNVLSYDLIVSNSENNYKCNDCKVSFCFQCLSSPFHFNLTCEEVKLNKKSAFKCVYDESIINPTNTDDYYDVYDNYNDSPIYICKNQDCIEKFNDSCKRKLECGHKCSGHVYENECLDCLDDKCEYYRDRFTYTYKDLCGICYTDELYKSPLCRLDCSHVFHYKCIEELLKKGYPGPEISFNFLNCPSCKKEISCSNNDFLSKLVNKFKKLKGNVVKLAKERVTNEKKTLNKEITIDKLLFFMCFSCEKPYFGGYKHCQMLIDQHDYDKKDLICGGCCSLNDISGLTNCQFHGKEYIEYKCKFCCSIACWQCGSTHYCDGCHSKYPTVIEKCLGKERCDLGIDHPENGNEFGLGCSLCRYKKYEY